MRVVVIGSSCAGKSTFAKALAATKNCSHIELDELYWGPNWTPRPQGEFLESVAQATSDNHWVASGNYSPARDILWGQATTIVWLNFSLPVLLWRGIKRTAIRTATRQVLFHGNRESFKRSFFSKESILWWIISTFRRRRQEFEALRFTGHFDHLHWLEAQHPRAAAEILRALQNSG